MGIVTIDEDELERLRDNEVKLKQWRSKGGKVTALRLTPKQRSENARRAGKAGGRGRPKHKRANSDPALPS